MHSCCTSKASTTRQLSVTKSVKVKSTKLDDEV